MKKIAITGSSGFVGSYLVKYFSKLNFEITAFNRKNWDLREEYNEEFDFDIFIHSAADTGYEKSKKKG
ncbi:MAG: NAD-dependent epimerase/dehydratase family protein [Candidatus Gracilibacteria bacterium]|nr:NAD-dependent epimerase/dehydratase family protein [Candidatus Gracilibacteria bacterium]